MGGGVFSMAGRVIINGCSFTTNTATGGNGGMRLTAQATDAEEGPNMAAPVLPAVTEAEVAAPSPMRALAAMEASEAAVAVPAATGTCRRWGFRRRRRRSVLLRCWWRWRGAGRRNLRGQRRYDRRSYFAGNQATGGFGGWGGNEYTVPDYNAAREGANGAGIGPDFFTRAAKFSLY